MENERIERQREVTKAGKRKECEVIELLRSVPDIERNFIIDRPLKIKKGFLKKEKLEVPYNDRKEKIDTDVCAVRKADKRLACMISEKKSFREQGEQTAYWVKLHNKNYKCILVTPDTDQKLYNPEKPKKKENGEQFFPLNVTGFLYIALKEKFTKKRIFFVDFIRRLASE